MRKLTDAEFLAGPAMSDWRIDGGHAVASFATGSFSAGVAFITAIGVIADAANHHPDVELTYPRVTVGLVTHDAGGVLTELDRTTAQEISRAASELGIAAAGEA